MNIHVGWGAGRVLSTSKIQQEEEYGTRVGKTGESALIMGANRLV